MTIAYAPQVELPTDYYAQSVATSGSASAAKMTASALFFVAVFSGTSATAPISASFPLVAPHRGEAHVAAPSVAAPMRDAQSDSEVVTWLKSTSGLTWDQLARVFGVSRRAVHLWASGARVNSANAEALREFASVVSANRRASADGTRAALLAVHADGRSAIDAFRQTRASLTEISGTPFTPAELLGGE